MDYSKIGKRIAEKRQKINMSQEELAEKVDSSANYISNLERNKRHPSLCMLIKIANVLDISIDYLLLDDEEIKRNENNVVLNETLKAINKLDENDREEFISYVKNFAENFYQNRRKNVKNG